MLLALVVATALEAATPQTVQLTPAGNAGAPVSAARRSLSDVARELREGRKATGGFSAVETTVPREPVDLRFVPWEEEEVREPDVVPEPQPPGVVSNEIYGGWGGGGWAPVPPRRRPPHVSHHGSGNRRPAHAAVRPAPAPAAAPARTGSTRPTGVPAHPDAAPRSAPVGISRRPG